MSENLGVIHVLKGVAWLIVSWFLYTAADAGVPEAPDFIQLGVLGFWKSLPPPNKK